MTISRAPRRVFPALACFVTAGLALLLSPLARADAASEARKSIQAAYDQENAALLKKDLKGTFARCRPDMQVIGPNNQPMTFAQMKQALADQLRLLQPTKSVTSIQKFALKGNQATCTVKDHSELTRQIGKGKLSHFVMEGMEEDVWIKDKTGWMRKSIHLLSQSLTQDGRPMTGM